MKFGFFPPRAGWFQFKMRGGADYGKRSVRQRKSRVASNRIAQVLSSFLEYQWIAAGTEPETPHEFRIGHWVLAVPCATLQSLRAQRPIQGYGNLLGDLVFNLDRKSTRLNSSHSS